MDINFKNLKKIIKLMKKEGLIRLKYTPFDGFEVNLDEKYLMTVQTKEINQENLEDRKDDIKTPQYSEEDLILWSAPGINPDGSKE